MARQSFRLEGVKEMNANLDILGKEIATKIGRKANRDAAKAFAVHLKPLVPNRPGVQKKRGQDYGDLRDNIRVKLERARQATTITYAVSLGKGFWGRFLEYGTRNMAARPFMRAAFDSYVSTVLDKQIEGMRTGIARAAKKLKVPKP